MDFVVNGEQQLETLSGSYLYEQKIEGKLTKFIKHPIDLFHSQFHTMEWVDIDNDG